MRGITPNDIQSKQFRIKFRGFDMEEVSSFLEIIREDLEELLRENATIRDQLSRAEEQLNEYRKMESTLRETLIVAQQLAEQYKTNALKEAELIKREAEQEAERIIQSAQEKVIKIHEDIIDLKGIRRHFKEELKRLIESHAKMLEFDKEREGENQFEI
ncbi:MAG: DivIVA domain-containing protein [Thermodesulfovibrionales bacterium]|nr:DivIVA domain-containing protein [Thermodesulfovibrionales bacterium]